jgi:hypothetical protein
MMAAQEKFETDVITTSAGDLEITFLGHGRPRPVLSRSTMGL